MQCSKDLVISSNLHCSPHHASKRYIKPLVKLVKKITKLKSQENMLETYGELDIFTSIRPKVGKDFAKSEHSLELSMILQEARLKIVEIAKREKQDEIMETHARLDCMYEELQKLPFPIFQSLQRRAKKEEVKLKHTLSKNVKRKIEHFKKKSENPALIAPIQKLLNEIRQSPSKKFLRNILKMLDW